MTDKWDEMAKKMKQGWETWPINKPAIYWPKEADIATALRAAHAEGMETIGRLVHDHDDNEGWLLMKIDAAIRAATEDA